MADSRLENPRYNTVTTTFSDAELRALKLWIEKQQPKPSKSVAIRNFTLAGLGLLERNQLMCNDFGNRVNYREYVDEFSLIKLPLLSPGPNAAPNLEPRDEIWPSETAPIIRPVKGGVELVQVKWGLAPSRPKAPLIINMRSEGREFVNGRCLVPASHYYEFTGSKNPKERWKFTSTEGAWFCFAGVLGRGADREGNAVEAFSLLTCDAGPDVAAYHARQPIVLQRNDWLRWLNPSTPSAQVLKPSPRGSLTVVNCPREAPEQASLL